MQVPEHMPVPLPAPVTNLNPEPIDNQLTTPTEPIVKYPYLWDTKENVRHSIRLICDEEGLTVAQKNDLSATLKCETGYKPLLVHDNVVNGVVETKDYGLCAVNDWWHIANSYPNNPGKDFPSTQYVLDNPEVVMRWMCKQWKNGNAKAWVCYSRGLYKQYL